VYGLGFKATLMVPVAQTAVAGAQYCIGDAETWRKVCENLAAIVAELDRTFVPEPPPARLQSGTIRTGNAGLAGGRTAGATGLSTGP
jgi:hypothetical protein